MRVLATLNLYLHADHLKSTSTHLSYHGKRGPRPGKKKKKTPHQANIAQARVGSIKTWRAQRQEQPVLLPEGANASVDVIPIFV